MYNNTLGGIFSEEGVEKEIFSYKGGGEGDRYVLFCEYI